MFGHARCAQSGTGLHRQHVFSARRHHVSTAMAILPSVSHARLVSTITQVPVTDARPAALHVFPRRCAPSATMATTWWPMVDARACPPTVRKSMRKESAPNVPMAIKRCLATASHVPPAYSTYIYRYIARLMFKILPQLLCRATVSTTHLICHCYCISILYLRTAMNFVRYLSNYFPMFLSYMLNKNYM